MSSALRERRIEANLTQKEIAFRVGISERSYRFIEADKRDPSVRTATRIADELGIDDYQVFKTLFPQRQPKEQKVRHSI